MLTLDKSKIHGWKVLSWRAHGWKVHGSWLKSPRFNLGLKCLGFNLGFKFPTSGMKPNISSVVEFQRWWVLKSKVFGRESTYSKEIVVFYEYNKLRFVKKCQNHSFKVDSLCQKLTEFFDLFFINEYQFRRPSFVKKFFFS